MGLVYKARDMNLERFVAIKLLHPWAIRHAARRAGLRREAQLAGSLNHPNIVTVHGLEAEDETEFIVMEYADGEPLSRILRRRQLSVREAVGFALQLAEALASAHVHGVIHRDVKPPNIIVRADGLIKLVDFSLASKAPGEDNDHRGFGSLAWQAPEQLNRRGMGGDAVSEVFSFGLLLHRMLGGRHPFAAKSAARIASAIRARRPSPLPPEVPRALRRVVTRCLAKRRSKRFQTMEHVCEALRRAAH